MLSFNQIMRMTPNARAVWVLFCEHRDTEADRSAIIALTDDDLRSMPDWMRPGMKMRRYKKIALDPYAWHDPFYGLAA